MVKLYFYNLSIEFLNASHLYNQTFFEKIDNPQLADFLFISLTNQTDFFKDLEKNDYTNKKIVLYNFTEPIALGSAKQFLKKCIKLGLDKKNILFHSTNHFLDNFNCLAKGLSVTDHIVKSQLDAGFLNVDERFLKFSFLNNSVRTPRALVLNELLSRNLNFNQSYVGCNGDLSYGDRNIQKFENIKNNLDILKSHDYDKVYEYTILDEDKKFQLVYKNSLFSFVIETFSDFGMDNDGVNCHLTEKTIRNFGYKIPFLLLISSKYQIKIIEELGFVLYNDLFDFKIDTNDVDGTVKSYVDIIEQIAKMRSFDVKQMVLQPKFQERVEYNHHRFLCYKHLNIENIYKYILSNSYEDKNDDLLNTNENEDIRIQSIISSMI